MVNQEVQVPVVDHEEVKNSNKIRLQEILVQEEAVEDEKEKFSAQEAERIERVIFEEDEIVKLRDGKTYKIPPCTFKDARKLMKLLRTVNVDVIIVNFLPTGNEEQDEKRIHDLYDMIMLAFKSYPEVTREYLEEYVDLKIAHRIIEVMIDLNGLKK